MGRDLTYIVAHRPYSLPDGPWIMKQTWAELLFAHWRVPAAELRARVPRELEIDEHDGSAWIGMAAFKVVGLHARFLPPLPGTSRFPELNVRTYVTYEGRPGVFFFSLDAGNTLAVETARGLFRLPYFKATMQHMHEGDWIRFQSHRSVREGPDFIARYRPVGAVFEAERGSLDHFLIERYCLYTGALGPRIFRVDIHHPPWQLTRAEARIDINTMGSTVGIALPGDQPLLHFSRHQPTLVWAPQLVARQAA